MMQTVFQMLQGVDPARLEGALRLRIDLATARAADIVKGKLAVFSSKQILHARTGTLARLWSEAKPERRAEGEYALINRAPYARIHEEGGEIVPKKAKMLAIPLPGPATTARGVARYPSARAAFEAEKLFVLKSKNGNLLLAKRVGRDRLELWYALKDKVTLTARQYATQAIMAARDRATEEVKRALTR
jgi:hypothetical protein